MKKEMMGLIVKRDDGSEIVNYDNPSFPSYIYDGWVAPKVTWERVPHFHEDIEMIAVKEGRLAYSVNGKTLILEKGDTLFVNSNRIHYIICLDNKLARYVVFVANPGIISTSTEVQINAVFPVTQTRDISYLRFHGFNEHAADIHRLMLELPDIRHDAFQVTRHFLDIWDIILRQSTSYGLINPVEEAADVHCQSFKAMMYYISQNYAEKITLDDIADGGNISKSLCNKLFNLYVGESPVSYVMHYRSRKAAEMLRSTDDTLSSIADRTGFCGTSYMAETFRKYIGMSPTQYRRTWKEPGETERVYTEACGD